MWQADESRVVILVDFYTRNLRVIKLFLHQIFPHIITRMKSEFDRSALEKNNITKIQYYIYLGWVFYCIMYSFLVFYKYTFLLSVLENNLRITFMYCMAFFIISYLVKILNLSFLIVGVEYQKINFSFATQTKSVNHS